MGFLITAMLIWGAMHAYVWAHARAHAGLGPRAASILALAMLLLMVAPIWGMSLVRSGRGALGRPVEIVGMVWTGMFFLLFSVCLVHGVWNGVLALGGRAYPALRSARLTGPYVFAAEVALVLVLAAYSMLAAWRIRTERVQVESPKLSAAVPRVRIVQITDVHLGTMVGRRRLARIVKQVRRLTPDVLVSTGDLVDAEMQDADDLARLLADLPAALGKYAVTGNHEYYAGLDEASDFTRRAGFRLLSDEAASPCEGLVVAGVNDSTARRWGGDAGGGRSEQDVLRDAAGGGFVVLLKHRPLVEPESLELMDMQLSGHTHGGQIFPFSLLVAAHYEYAHGLVEPEPGTYLYTSRGTGTWGPPMRFLSPPEVTVIDVVRTEP